jgi:hypothetical protein
MIAKIKYIEIDQRSWYYDFSPEKVDRIQNPDEMKSVC